MSQSQKNVTYGIALLLLNNEGKLFCVKELVPKPEIGKNVGDYSFPWETQEKGESDQSTLARLIREEVHQEEIRISEPRLLGEFSVIEDTLARVYVAHFLSGAAKLVGLHEGTEIESLGWQTKEFLLSHCREGVSKALLLLEQFEKKQQLV